MFRNRTNLVPLRLLGRLYSSTIFSPSSPIHYTSQLHDQIQIIECHALPLRKEVEVLRPETKQLREIIQKKKEKSTKLIVYQFSEKEWEDEYNQFHNTFLQTQHLFWFKLLRYLSNNSRVKPSSLLFTWQSQLAFDNKVNTIDMPIILSNFKTKALEWCKDWILQETQLPENEIYYVLSASMKAASATLFEEEIKTLQQQQGIFYIHTHQQIHTIGSNFLLPLLSFPPHFQIIVTDDTKTIQEWVQAFIIEKNCKAVGVDLETQPHFFKQASVPSTVQIATNESCLIIQTRNGRLLPPSSIYWLMKNPQIAKVFVGKAQDEQFLKAWAQKSAPLYFNNSNEVMSGYGLASLCSRYLGKSIHKDVETTLSYWDKSRLDTSQIMYAAMDAYATLLVFQAKSNSWNC